jgi:hypothetical protein
VIVNMHGRTTIKNYVKYYNLILYYYNLMGPPSYMRSVVDRKVVIRRKTVYGSHDGRGSSVGTETTILVRRSQNRYLISAQARDVSLLQSVQTACEALPDSYSTVITGSYNDGKAAGA